MNQIIFKIIAVVIAGVAVYLSYTTAQQVIKNQAIDGCMKATSARFKNDLKQDVTTPDGFWYELCLKEKGLK